MAKFESLTSHVIPLPVANIDTDQIIPARFLKATDKVGMGEHLFADWRYLPGGEPNPSFVLNKAEYQGAQILLAGDNFGCGSSREHAPWALVGWGIRVVISTNIADIFRNNALKNGLIPIVVDPTAHAMLFDVVHELPKAEWTVDLEKQALVLPTGEELQFDIDPFSRTCLLRGIDELGYILTFESRILAFEQANQDLLR